MVKRKPASGQEPQILEMTAQKMAVIHTKGDPNVVGAESIPPLYSSVYALKFDLKKKSIDFKIASLRARWPNAHLAPKSEWTGIWGLPVPDDTTSLPQKPPGFDIKIETWQYGTVAQILHVGPFETEMATVERLHQFVAANGYQIAGPHEEEYLTTPRAKVQKTLIRYSIRKA
ncbi:MAG: GyrI-like domain-containing protein [Chloroflexota bacterium]